MAARLTVLPLWWLTDPTRADRETRRMVSEKEDAWLALQRQLVLAPSRFWLEMWQGMLNGDKDSGLARATHAAGQSLSVPYTSRVRANRKRLQGSVR